MLDVCHVQEFPVGGLIEHANPAYRLTETEISRLNSQIQLAFLWAKPGARLRGKACRKVVRL